MSGAPGLYAAFGNGVALGQVVKLLIGVLYIDDLLHAAADGLLECILDLMLDDKNHGIKAGTLGIINGIVDYKLAMIAHGIDLLETAVTAAHARCHDHKYRFIHNRNLLSLTRLYIRWGSCSATSSCWRTFPRCPAEPSSPSPRKPFWALRSTRRSRRGGGGQ